MHERLPYVPAERPRRSAPSRRARRGPLPIALAVLVSALLSCGGSSSKSDPKTTPQGSSNWDQLVWDQDKWS